MKMTITESTVNSFELIQSLSQQNILAGGNFINLDNSLSETVKSFEALSMTRPRIKSLGIHTIISLKNLYVELDQKSCIQIAFQYIQGIRWDDLQYICFLDIQTNNIFIHIVFNRVTPQGKLIDIGCLGANWQQYEVLRQACSRIIENPVHNKYLQTRFCNCCTN